MKKPSHVDPLDALGAAYETMYEHVAANIHKVKDKSGPLLHELVDEAKDKVLELEEVAEEDAEKISTWLKRDLHDVTHYLSEVDYTVKDWLGFETALIKSEIIRLLLETADKTTVQLLRMKENAGKPSLYHTGEIAGPGTLICDDCGEKLHFHKAGHIPPCPKCHKTEFRRIQIE
ncbi:MAG: zinc ribbon-containing protein [Gammaproteobacteria bacterium]|nr:zinc ribbon-containing protein [Gammaproteobacteria bacterium]